MTNLIYGAMKQFLENKTSSSSGQEKDQGTGLNSPNDFINLRNELIKEEDKEVSDRPNTKMTNPETSSPSKRSRRRSSAARSPSRQMEMVNSNRRSPLKQVEKIPSNESLTKIQVNVTNVDYR